jgi:hypothetical protein
MKRISKVLTGAAAAAVLSVGVAAPAIGQSYYDGYYRDRDTTARVVAGVAGVAAAVSAAANGQYGYQYPGYGYPGYGQYPGAGYAQPRYGYGYGADPQRLAIDTCTREAQRVGGGRVTQIREVGWKRGYFRVRGYVDGGYRVDPYRGYGYGYGNSYGRQMSFRCDAMDGRIFDFKLDRSW